MLTQVQANSHDPAWHGLMLRSRPLHTTNLNGQAAFYEHAISLGFGKRGKSRLIARTYWRVLYFLESFMFIFTFICYSPRPTHYSLHLFIQLEIDKIVHMSERLAWVHPKCPGKSLNLCSGTTVHPDASLTSVPMNEQPERSALCTASWPSLIKWMHIKRWGGSLNYNYSSRGDTIQTPAVQLMRDAQESQHLHCAVHGSQRCICTSFMMPIHYHLRY